MSAKAAFVLENLSEDEKLTLAQALWDDWRNHLRDFPDAPWRPGMLERQERLLDRGILKIVDWPGDEGAAEDESFQVAESPHQALDSALASLEEAHLGDRVDLLEQLSAELIPRYQELEEPAWVDAILQERLARARAGEARWTDLEDAIRELEEWRRLES